MTNKTTPNLTNYCDDELDDVMAEAVEKFTQCNIRLRSPNRSAGPTRQQKALRPEREPS